MLEATFADRGPLSLLCIGAHADDIEIGCAGTVMSLARAGLISSVRWVVLSAPGVRAAEARAGAAAVLEEVPDRHVDIREFRDGFFPEEFGNIKRFFETLKSKVRPDLILAHQRSDLHQDHNITAELTWQTFRDHTILEFEVPKYDGGLKTPNLYVPIQAEEAARKWQILRDSYPSQARRTWFRAETFESLARLRGIECNSPTGLAEGFNAKKLCWAIRKSLP